MAAFAMGAMVVTSGSAPAQTLRFGFGNRPHYNRPYYRPLYRPYYRTYRPAWNYPTRSLAPLPYRNGLTSDVDYAERLGNDFRAAYEREGDPWGVRSDVQKMDEAMEQLRTEAREYGRKTLRGADLLERAQTYADRIDRRSDDQDGRLASRWQEAKRALNRLASVYR